MAENKMRLDLDTRDRVDRVASSGRAAVSRVNPVKGAPYSACSCGSHAQHEMLRWRWRHPSGTLKQAAMDLHITHQSAKQRASRLMRRPDISRLCPECFRPCLNRLICTNCGVELDSPELPQGIRFEETSPVHAIQSLGGLGSVTAYSRLGLRYGGRNIAHMVEKPRDSLLERSMSMLWEELKAAMPGDMVTDEAARMLSKEVRDFRARYPGLARSRFVANQLVQNVVARLAARYPDLRGRTLPVGRA